MYRHTEVHNQCPYVMRGEGIGPFGADAQICTKMSLKMLSKCTKTCTKTKEKCTASSVYSYVKM